MDDDDDFALAIKLSLGIEAKNQRFTEDSFSAQERAFFSSTSIPQSKTQRESRDIDNKKPGRISEDKKSYNNNRNHNHKYDEDLILAKKLQDEELKQSLHCADQLDYDGDYSLALELQQQETKESKNSLNISKHAKNENSSDLLPSRKLKSFLLGQQSLPDIAPGIVDICPTCRNPFVPGSSSIRAMDRRYHISCMRCAACDEQITGPFVPHGSPAKPYHRHCYDDLFRPKCCLCNDMLPNQYYRANPILEPDCVGFCMTHKRDDRQCCACHRYEPLCSSGSGKVNSSRNSSNSGSGSFTTLPDGRKLCMDCVGSAVLNSDEALPLYLAAVDFMESALGLPIPAGMREVPVLAVDSTVMQEQWNATAGTSSHSNDPTQSGGTSGLRGLTVSTAGEVRHYSPGTVSFTPSLRGWTWTESPPVVVNLVQFRAVTAVLVLFGLPRDLTASILAHEAMHVWLRLRSDMPSSLPPVVEEGLCQLIASKYLGGQGGEEGLRRGRGGGLDASNREGNSSSSRPFG
eukprot:gene38743-50912_t